MYLLVGSVEKQFKIWCQWGEESLMTLVSFLSFYIKICFQISNVPNTSEIDHLTIDHLTKIDHLPP